MSIIHEVASSLTKRGVPKPSLKQHILKNNVHDFSDEVYHGSPALGLLSMLRYGINGHEHGEVAEYATFSTSINPDVLWLFSEGAKATGISFAVKGAKIVVLDDILSFLVTALPGSGMDVDVDQEQLDAFIAKFGVPSNQTYGPHLPYDYLSSLGVDGFMYDSVYKAWKSGINFRRNDEMEICFIGQGIEKLSNMISGIFVAGHEYKVSEKDKAIMALGKKVVPSPRRRK
jgi:hypothetical protein